MDPKIKNSPLFMAKKYQVDPQYAFTIDLKDVFNYRKKFIQDRKDIHIFVWVKWEAKMMVTSYSTKSVKKMGGIWSTKISNVLNHLEKNRKDVSIHWYKESFRKPPFFDPNDSWAQELLDFEPRLLIDEKVKNITSQGFYIPTGQDSTFPTGQSSGSYVLDLSNKSLFENIYFWMKNKKE